ncbi:MAG: outer membrane protein assembly factor BamA [Spirochaetales bacterium]|nr:MAG: outer membrane protein assembly factor BamA [Spirochaetales bacterium]
MRKAISMRRFAALALVLAFATAAVLAQPADDWYMGKKIKDIRFEGLVIVAQSDLDTTLKEYKGKTFTEELWMALLSRVYALDYFDEIAPEAVPADSSYSTVIVMFKVKEKPAVVSVTVEGNSGLRDSELLDAAAVKTKTIFNQSRLRLDEIAIRQLYQKKGYLDIVVSSSFASRADGSVDVTYTVDEGFQNIIDKIQFEGVSSFSPNALKGELTVKEKALFQSGEFSESKLEEGIFKLELYYKKRGFVDAKVVNVVREASEVAGKKRMLSLTFVVAEGSKYLYDGMSFAGNTIFPSDQLERLVRQKPGAVLNYQRLVEDQGRATDLYFDNGYIFNGFDLTETRDEERGAIAYTLTITERNQALIERIEFRGNIKTKDNVLRREIPIKDGDIFSKAKIMEGLRNLYNLQYFSALTPEYEQGSVEPYVVLTINVEEQSTADIQFGLSYVPSTNADTFPLVGLVKWNDRNFIGKGQTLSVGVNISPDTQDITLGFKENWLMGQRWSGGVDFSFKHSGLAAATDNDFNGVPDPYATYEDYVASGKYVPTDLMMNYDTWAFSLGLSSGYTFKLGFADFGLGGGYIFGLSDKTYDETISHPYDSTISENLNRWLPSNTLYARMFLNGLDLWYDPSNGYYASQRIGLTGFLPSELSRFIRSDTKAEGYLTLLDANLFETVPLKAVLGAHSGFTALLPWFGDNDVAASSSEMLRIDGTFVGRGWGQQLSSITGIGLWESWMELRVPVVTGVLSFDTFLDAAALLTPSGLLDIRGLVEGESSTAADTDWSDLGAGNFAFSFGMGLRFAIPQFPFRLYFAKRFYAGSDGLSWADDAGGWDFVLSITQPLY